MNRRSFLSGVAVAGLSGCARKAAISGLPSYEVVPALMPIRAELDRIFRVTVCLRPFRAEVAGRFHGVPEALRSRKLCRPGSGTWVSSDAAHWG